MNAVHTTIFWFLRLSSALPAQPSYPKHKADFSAFFTYFLYGWYFSGCQFHIISKSAHLVLHFLLRDNCHLLYIAETEQAQHIAACHSYRTVSMPLSHLPSPVSVSKPTEPFLTGVPLLTLQIALSGGVESDPEGLVKTAHTLTLSCSHFLHLGEINGDC